MSSQVESSVVCEMRLYPRSLTPLPLNFWRPRSCHVRTSTCQGGSRHHVISNGDKDVSTRYLMLAKLTPALQNLNASNMSISAPAKIQPNN